MKRVGRYEILGLLGRGGMGVVFRALLPVVDRMVAVKLLKPDDLLLELLGAREIERRFLLEARMLGAVRHANIATLLDFDRDDHGRPFLVMEYYCRNLGLVLGKEQDIARPGHHLLPETGAAYLQQLLSALSRLHHAGIVHRDVTPSNLLLTDDNQVKLVDFGMSHPMKCAGNHTIPKGLRIGTPYYAAPEQELDPDGVDQRADLYSCGVLAWRMFTGRLPRRGQREESPGDVNPVLGPVWDSFLARGVAHDPEERFPSAAAMIDALDRTLAAWQAFQDGQCRLEQEAAAGGGRGRPRFEPARVYASDARSVFQLDGLNRPLRHRTGTFRVQENGLVADERYKLIWQQSGAPHPMSWNGAQAYVAGLNRDRLDGKSDWRLPTVDELFTMLSPVKEPGDLCQDAVFDRQMKGLWSADTRSRRSAWFVDTELGYTSSQSRSCRFYVRAVRSSTGTKRSPAKLGRGGR